MEDAKCSDTDILNERVFFPSRFSRVRSGNRIGTFPDVSANKWCILVSLKVCPESAYIEFKKFVLKKLSEIQDYKVITYLGSRILEESLMSYGKNLLLLSSLKKIIEDPKKKKILQSREKT